MEKAPTTILVELRKDHNGWAALRIFTNQISYCLSSLWTSVKYHVYLLRVNSLLPLGRYIDMDPSTTELVVSQTQFIRFGQFLLG